MSVVKSKAKTGNTVVVNRTPNPNTLQKDFERVMHKYNVRTPEQARWNILFTHLFELLRHTVGDDKGNIDIIREYKTDLRAVERFEVYLADEMLDAEN
ncbi:MAG: hypothetical protein HOP30_19530 [Cyclobacteriaceae bacterium]|nr:hypothetical protein [Cyclobacteriaceae bacterium]